MVSEQTQEAAKRSHSNPRIVRNPPQSELATLALASLPTAVLVLEPRGQIIYANARATSTLGQAAEHLVGRLATEVFGLPAFALDELAAGKPGERRIEVEVTLPSSKKIVVGLSAGVFQWGDRGDHRTVVFEDVSSVGELRRQRDRLVQLAAVGDVLPALLHELKNPLAAVTTSVEVLLEELHDENAHMMLHAVLGEVRRMKLTFDGVGAVGRSLRTPQLHEIDVACREAFRVLEPRGAAAGIIMRADVGELPPLPLDPAVMRAIVFNLVTNAIHAASTWNTVNLHVRLVERGTVLELQVVDNGVGMTAEVLARCTELFYTTKSHGSGVGLALCKNTVEEAGGTLDIASVPGTGTRVTVNIPIRRDGGRTT